MDPTKPILDIYSQSQFSQRQERQQPIKQNFQKSSYSNYSNQKYHQTLGSYHNQRKNQPTYTQLKEKYQELYRAYSQRTEKISSLEISNEQLADENARLRENMEELRYRNQQLNENLINKNNELEQAYRRLQMEGQGSRIHGNDEALVEKLQDGLKVAITSNFQLLRESALSELRQYLQ